MRLLQFVFLGLAAGLVAFSATPATPVLAADNVITIGAAVSFTGRYAINGKHTKNGYDLAVERVNSMGGIDVGGTSYMIEIKYYDDESTAARGTQLVERLIQQDGVKLMLGPYSSGMTKAMAAYYAPRKIRVNAIAPALVRSAMSQRAQGDEEIMAYVNGKQPLVEGMQEADEIADAAVFLMSAGARSMTGDVITVDAGWCVSEGVHT